MSIDPYKKYEENIFEIKDNIVIISKDLFINKINIITEISSLAVPNEINIATNNGLLLIYINTSKITDIQKRRYGSINIDSLEKFYIYNMEGFMLVDFYRGLTSEIHDIHINKNSLTSRNIIITSLLKTMVNGLIMEYSKLWSYIKLDPKSKKPNNELIDSHLKAGFIPIEINNQSPNGNKKDFYFISFIFNKIENIINPSENVITKRKKLVDNLLEIYDVKSSVCGITVYIPSREILKIRNTLMNKDKEYSGVFGVADYKSDKSFKSYTLMIPTNSIRYDNSIISDNKAEYYITWHTHPIYCHDKKCYMTWPTGNDMKLVIVGYPKGIICHLIFTDDGVYIITLRHEMMAFMNKIKDNPVDIETIGNLISLRFTVIEDFCDVLTTQSTTLCVNSKSLDCLLKDKSSKTNDIRNFMNLSGITLGDILDNICDVKVEEASIKSVADIFIQSRNIINSHKVFDAKIFDIEFLGQNIIEQDGISKNLSYTLPEFNGSCPLPIYNKQPFWGFEQF